MDGAEAVRLLAAEDSHRSEQSRLRERRVLSVALPVGPGWFSVNAVVSGESVYPQVAHFNLEIVAPGTQELRDVYAVWSKADTASVDAVHLDFCRNRDFAEIENRLAAIGCGERGFVGCWAGIELYGGIVGRGKIGKSCHDNRLLGSAMERIGKERYGPWSVDFGHAAFA